MNFNIEQSAMIEIEQDGPHYRWVLMLGETRLAKGAQWWSSEDEARDAADEFLEALRHMEREE